MKKIWAVILTVVIMAGLAGGGYYYLNKQNQTDKKTLQSQIDDLSAKLTTEKAASTAVTATTETADWKTYSNAKYGISIRYPIDWTATEKSVKETTASPTATDFVEFTQNGKTYQIEGTDSAPISIRFGSSSGKTGYEIAVSNKTNTNTGNETVNKVTLDGVEAGKLINYLSTSTYVVKSGTSISISLVNFGDDKTNAPLEQIYNNMLDSFRFTK